MGESKQKTLRRTCTDSIRVIKAGLLEQLLQCAAAGDVWKWGQGVWSSGAWHWPPALSQGPFLCMPVTRLRTVGTMRGPGLRHMLWRHKGSVCLPLQPPVSVQSHNACILYSYSDTHVWRGAHTHKQASRGIQNIGFGRIQVRSKERFWMKSLYYEQFILSEQFTRNQ